MGYFKSSNIKIDNNTIKYDSNGQLYANVSGSGGVDIDDDNPSLSTTYSSSKIEDMISEVADLPVADDTTLGCVKIDGDTITIDENGFIHSTGGGGSSSLPTEIVDPQDGEVLTYNEMLHRWVNAAGGGGGGGIAITPEQIIALFDSDDEYILDGDNYSV